MIELVKDEIEEEEYLSLKFILVFSLILTLFYRVGKKRVVYFV